MVEEGGRRQAMVNKMREGKRVRKGKRGGKERVGEKRVGERKIESTCDESIFE
jgi:hypothetical protein